jgi:hypothetical protein
MVCHPFDVLPVGLVVRRMETGLPDAPAQAIFLNATRSQRI